MAFANLQLKDSNGIGKNAPVGFSWTTLFFGFFPALIRGDWLYGIIMLGAAMITAGISTIVFAFIYNKIYIQNLIKAGYKVTGFSGADKNTIESKLQIKLP